jgi:hypothetical protein
MLCAPKTSVRWDTLGRNFGVNGNIVRLDTCPRGLHQVSDSKAQQAVAVGARTEVDSMPQMP